MSERGQLRKMGKPTGGAAPFGYKWVNRELVPDETEAPVRRLIYELFDVFTVTNWEKRGLPPSIRYYPAIIKFLGYDPLPATGEGAAGQVKAKRLGLGLSQWALAQRLGVDEQTVRSWEQGQPPRNIRCRVLLQNFLADSQVKLGSNMGVKNKKPGTEVPGRRWWNE